MLNNNRPHGDISIEEFRRAGHEIIDWIAGYLEAPEAYPVLSRVKPGEVAARIPATPPDSAESLAAILGDFRDILLPGITHWNHPGFFAYFGISGSAPGILGELLCAALNVNAMLWKTSPSATELEEVTLDWLRQLLGLPDHFRGVITDTASISSLLAIVAAREAIPGLDARHKGLAGRPEVPRLRLYVSDQTHSSVEKGAMTAGIGQEGVRKIPSDSNFRMSADLLDGAISEDRAAGWLPFCVVATIGTTSTTSVDPVPAISEICRREGLWLHVDAAYGGAAAILPEMQHYFEGWDLADSIVMNPHKWLFTPVDCSALYLRDPKTVTRAFSLVADYLVTEGDVTNYMDWGVQLGRRFRSLKLWMVLRALGREGIAGLLREHIRLAQRFAARVDSSPHFERMAPTPMSVVCFRAHPAGINSESEIEKINLDLIASVNATGEAFIASTRLNGKLAIRFAIGNIRTTGAHVDRAWALIHGAIEGSWPQTDT